MTVLINLRDATGALIKTTITGTDGLYAFTVTATAANTRTIS